MAPKCTLMCCRKKHQAKVSCCSNDLPTVSSDVLCVSQWHPKTIAEHTAAAQTSDLGPFSETDSSQSKNSKLAGLLMNNQPTPGAATAVSDVSVLGFALSCILFLGNGLCLGNRFDRSFVFMLFELSIHALVPYPCPGARCHRLPDPLFCRICRTPRSFCFCSFCFCRFADAENLHGGCDVGNLGNRFEQACFSNQKALQVLVTREYSWLFFSRRG